MQSVEKKRQRMDLLPEQEGHWAREAWGPRHRLVAQMIAAGFRNIEIAEALGYHVGYVSQIRQDPRCYHEVQTFQAKMADNIIDLNARLKAHATEALDEIVDEMRNCEDPRIRQKAAFGVLDRAGYTPVNKSIILGANIDSEVASRLEQTLDEFDAVDNFSYDMPEGTEVGSESESVEEESGNDASTEEVIHDD